MNEEQLAYLYDVKNSLEEQRLEAIRQLGRIEGAQALVNELLRRAEAEAQQDDDAEEEAEGTPGE